MILIIIAVHTVAANHVQRRIAAFQLGAHRLDIGGIVIVIDGIGLFLPNDRAADDILGLGQPELREFLRRQRDQIIIARRPQPITFEAEIFEADAGQAGIGHHFGRPAAEILHPPDLYLVVVDVDPVVGEQVFGADHQRNGEEIAVAQGTCLAEAGGQRMNTRRQLAHRCAADDMRSIDGDDAAIGLARLHLPAAGALILRQLLEAVAHQHMIAARNHLVARCFPHHPRPLAGIAEGFEQGLGFHAVIGLFVEAQTALQPVEHRRAKAQPLDPLRRPVRRHLVARHAPHLLGIGFEKDRIEFVAELVDRPILETAHALVGEGLGPGIARHAQTRTPDAQIEQRLEGAQRIAVEFALIIDAAHTWALDEIVGQNLVPQIDDFLRFREKAMPADVEAKALVLDRAADAADIALVLFDHRHLIALLGQQIGGGQPGRPRADDGDVGAGR